MDANLQRRVQRYGWDKASLHYEKFWEDQLRPAQEWLLETAQIQPGETIIDVACGTGLLSFPLAEATGESGAVLGTDISENMIELSRQIVKEKELHNVSFERMDGEALNISDATFDVAICSLGLMYMPTASIGISEMYRVLKPGGRMLSLVWGERSHCGWAEVFPIVETKVSSEVCPLFFQLGTANVLELLMQRAGFKETWTGRKRVDLHYDSDEEAYGAAFAGGPVAMAYSRFPEEMKQIAHREYLESIHAYKIGKRYNVPGEFVLASGVKR